MKDETDLNPDLYTVWLRTLWRAGRDTFNTFVLPPSVQSSKLGMLHLNSVLVLYLQGHQHHEGGSIKTTADQTRRHGHGWIPGTVEFLESQNSPWYLKTAVSLKGLMVFMPRFFCGCFTAVARWLQTLQNRVCLPADWTGTLPEPEVSSALLKLRSVFFGFNFKSILYFLQDAWGTDIPDSCVWDQHHPVKERGKICCWADCHHTL